jgi:YggT family protein
MSEFLKFLVNALLQYLLVMAFLLRVILPLVRANMRNQLSQAVLRVTNPLVLPLRKVLPPIGRIDTSSIVALILVQLAVVILLNLIDGYIGTPGGIALRVLYFLLVSILQFYTFAIVIYVILGWIAPATYSPANDLLSSLCEPILRPMQRLIPPIAGLDLSPVFVLVFLQALQLFAVPGLMRMLAGS